VIFPDPDFNNKHFDMFGVRRKARILALQVLYELDCSSHQPDKALARLLREKPLPNEAADFAKSLVAGFLQNRGDIDSVIRRFAPAYPIKQIAPIDRNILRLAIFEILFDNRVPMKAVINEAVELAKSFGSHTSQKFVNGVLGSVATTCVDQTKQHTVIKKSEPV
jgi:N utilization substance protein B